jgi:hypothetical protein
MSPVMDIIKLILTGRAHLQGKHSGIVPVVGQSGNNGVSRTAALTGSKRIMIPPVVDIHHFFSALLTHGKVRSNQ